MQPIFMDILVVVLGIATTRGKCKKDCLLDLDDYEDRLSRHFHQEWLRVTGEPIMITLFMIIFFRLCALFFYFVILLSLKCWNISELSTSPHQLKLLGLTGRCMQLNMVSKPEVSSSNPG